MCALVNFELWRKSVFLAHLAKKLTKLKRRKKNQNKYDEEIVVVKLKWSLNSCLHCFKWWIFWIDVVFSLFERFLNEYFSPYFHFKSIIEREKKNQFIHHFSSFIFFLELNKCNIYRLNRKEHKIQHLRGNNTLIWFDNGKQRVN